MAIISTTSLISTVNGQQRLVVDNAGNVEIRGNSSQAGALKIYEDSDNGTNYIAIQAPPSVASNVTFTLPTADGSAGQAIVTDGAGNLSFSSSPISTTGKSIAMTLIFAI